ncbi:uncharacterized protein ACLA_071200 [Aspergillus clavatus NRRL 1]|uniref:Uncharacterized protein n=1 Tax=Aspergillus clavatus (strain ATCC 1007 / CBS 513.65 / DSM 816 / NCTC 3887 / NRRL 1 / QM 1276 / 107) TaxID=344612 RepID=A1C6R6_ASPCL|nr:uncharacterized protein ACLA_071200 [Aspergillus clavatus NRRL 1]EAW14087.1 conserved hypothetical protein [Aspergillus clavatus NRRL 1]
MADIRPQKNVYERLRKSVQRFEAHIQGPLRTCITTTEQTKLLYKHRIMLSFDFEAAVSLEHWDDVPRIVDRANPIVDDKLCSVFIDCILRSAAPASNIVQVVKVCMSTSEPVPLQPRILTKRSTLYLAMDASDFLLAESVLDQAILLASDSSHSPDSESGYPREELDWLATTAFNRAVDFYLASADEDCRRWAESAFALADLVKTDGGALGRLLRHNFAKLS